MSGYARSTWYVNIDENGVNATAGECRVTDIIAINTTGATAFIQVFDAAVASVTLGTTVPLFEIPLAATTGYQHVPFSAPVHFTTRVALFSTTATGGSTGSADGVKAQVWLE